MGDSKLLEDSFYKKGAQNIENIRGGDADVKALPMQERERTPEFERMKIAADNKLYGVYNKGTAMTV